jgi:anaphase-promoting complex subunit 1
LRIIIIINRLSKYIDGGRNPNRSNSSMGPTGVNKSNLIMEGQDVNVDVTAAGAIIALGLMYLKTNNKPIASRLSIPTTKFLLDYMRPDLLLVRTLSRNLILWDHIQPTEEWISNQVPPVVKNGIGPKGDLDMKQAYVNILAGACLSIGMRFAGTANEDSMKILHKNAKYLEELQKAHADVSFSIMIENCLAVTLLALSVVMAGTVWPYFPGKLLDFRFHCIGTPSHSRFVEKTGKKVWNRRGLWILHGNSHGNGLFIYGRW